jgi:hypothetical protein
MAKLSRDDPATPSHPKFIVYQQASVVPAVFVSFWLPFYRDPRERLYVENIAKPLNREKIEALFIWKNGGRLSKLKALSIQRNYVSRLADALAISAEIPCGEALSRFPTGGAIWRIFWLHCCHPERFPIYDQHVHRAMVYMKENRIEELDDKSDKEKIELYLTQYLVFYNRFEGIDSRSVDRAVWTFGKFIKAWPLCTK